MVGAVSAARAGVLGAGLRVDKVGYALHIHICQRARIYLCFIATAAMQMQMNIEKEQSGLAISCWVAPRDVGEDGEVVRACRCIAWA